MRIRAALLIAAAVAAGAACRGLDPVVVHVDMPGVSPFPPDAFAEIVVTDLRNPPPSFWKDAAAGRERVVFLAGSVRLSSDVRKALKGRTVPLDGPFEAIKHGLIEKLHWSFVVDLSVVSGESGETIYERSFREDRDYIDLEKSPEFAFSDMSAAFRDRLFPALLASPEIEKRILLRR
jgi:hypothetical protein